MERELNTNNENIMEIDLMEIVMVLLNKIWLLLLVTSITAAFCFTYSVLTTVPQYQSTTSIYMLINRGDGTTIESQKGTDLIGDYQALISGRYVLEKVIEEEKLDLTYNQLKSKVSVSNQSDTRIILITVTDTNPKMAQNLANAIREGAAKHIKNVTRVEAVNTVDEANLPTAAQPSSHMRDAAIAGMIAFTLCAAVIMLIHLLDDAIYTEDDVTKYLQLSTLATIPEMEDEADPKKKKKRLKKKLMLK